MNGYRIRKFKIHHSTSTSLGSLIVAHKKIFGYDVLDVEIDWGADACIFTVECEDSNTIFDRLEGVEEVMYHFVNGDVVETRKTGEVFLYLGGMYYNLSSGDKEMRGRKAIKRTDGPVYKIANIANSGDLFKAAIIETVYQEDLDELPF